MDSTIAYLVVLILGLSLSFNLTLIAVVAIVFNNNQVAQKATHALSEVAAKALDVIGRFWNNAG
jgi:hypothetical protein